MKIIIERNEKERLLSISLEIDLFASKEEKRKILELALGLEAAQVSCSLVKKTEENPIEPKPRYEVGDMIIYEIDGKRDTAVIVSIGLSPHLYFNIAKSLKSTPIARIEFNQIINKIP